jgi:hypothetical protein
VLGYHVVTGWESYRDYYWHPNRPPLYGLYDVENGYEKWRKVALQYPGSMTVRTTDDTVLNMRLEYGKDTVTLNKKETWKWSRPDADHIVLESGDKLVKLRKIDASKFLLLSRGFHWINETPLNQ